MIYLLKIIQVFVDFVLILSSFGLAYFFRFSIYLIQEGKSTYIHSDYPIDNFYLNAFISAVFIIGIFMYQGRYSIDKPYRNFNSNFVSCLIGITVFVLIYFYNRELFFSRLIPVYAFIISFVLLFINNLIFRKFYSIKTIRENYGKRTLIIGANQSAENLIKNLLKNGSIRQVIGIIDAYGTKKKEIMGIKVLGKMNKFEQVINKYNVDEIIQADNQEQTLNIVTFCENRGISYYLIPSLSSGLFHENLEVYYLDNKPSIYLNQSNLDSWNLIFKRFIDIILSILLMPLFVILFIFQLIRNRKIFITEKRVSRGKVFEMFRFGVNASSKGEDRLATDDINENAKTNYLGKLDDHGIEVSFFDKFLIKTRLIEVAQIVNVFKGEMSFVGPRPPFEKEYVNYQEYYKKRLKVSPGITGLWQIRKTNENFDFNSMFKTDVEYIKNWSFFLDFKIIFITLISRLFCFKKGG